jgi:UDP-glucose 4-epimerase
MRVVVTGGAGFIGGNLVAEFESRHSVREVVVVDDMSTGDADNLRDRRARLLVGSILDPDLLDAALDGADAVVHLAAIPSVPRSVADPLRSHHVNATGTVEVLQAVRRAGGPHLVVASSSSVYGRNPTLPKHEGLRAEPLSPYGVSKLAAESYAIAFAECYGLSVIPFRFFNVFGPLQPAGHAYAAVIPAFLEAALTGRPLPVHGDGRQSRDFTYVATVCRVLADAAIERVATTDPVNLAFGTRTTLLQLIAEIEEALGHPVSVEHTPPREGDIRDSQADNGLLRRLFPSVEPTPLPTGLAETVAWFRSRQPQPAG